MHTNPSSDLALRRAAWKAQFRQALPETLAIATVATVAAALWSYALIQGALLSLSPAAWVSLPAFSWLAHLPFGGHVLLATLIAGPAAVALQRSCVGGYPAEP